MSVARVCRGVYCVCVMHVYVMWCLMRMCVTCVCVVMLDVYVHAIVDRIIGSVTG